MNPMPMTAPDSRDSVAAENDGAVAVVGADGYPHWLASYLLSSEWVLKTGDRLYTKARLQALARGNRASGSHPDALPDGTFSKSTVKRRRVLQQAGGEDVPEKVVAWMNEREAWRSPRAPSEPGTYALVLADDYSALQAEAARLLGQNERLASAVRDTITRAETAEAALRLAHSHLDMPALRVSHCKDAAAIDAAINGGQDDG